MRQPTVGDDNRRRNRPTRLWLHDVHDPWERRRRELSRAYCARLRRAKKERETKESEGKANTCHVEGKEKSDQSRS